MLTLTALCVTCLLTVTEKKRQALQEDVRTEGVYARVMISASQVVPVCIFSYHALCLHVHSLMPTIQQIKLDTDRPEHWHFGPNASPAQNGHTAGLCARCHASLFAWLLRQSCYHCGDVICVTGLTEVESFDHFLWCVYRSCACVGLGVCHDARELFAASAVRPVCECAHRVP